MGLERPTELYRRIFDFDNLLMAHKKTRLGKSENCEVLKFESRREENLIALQNELIWHTYQLSPTKKKYITDPKPREIDVPAYRDRVLQQALHSVLYPLFDKRMFYHSYACRIGKGTHSAADTAQKYAQAASSRGKYYFLKCDIKHCYGSINHCILKETIRRVIKEPDVIWLLDVMIDRFGEDGTGIPLGAVMSQLFANIYLDKLDHFIKDEMGIKRYLRYMDDFIVFSNDKKELQTILKIIRRWLQVNLKLELNSKTRITSDSEGCDFCGYRIWATHRLPRKRNIKKARRRLRKMCNLYKQKSVRSATVKQVWASFLGYVKHCSCHVTTVAIWQELNETLKNT